MLDDEYGADNRNYAKSAIANISRQGLQNKIALLESTSAALRNAFIMNHDAVDAARRLTRRNVMHYFDPPYINTKMEHYEGYTENDFAELLEFCANCAGRFVLSHFDNNAALTAAIERQTDGIRNALIANYETAQ